MYCLYHYQGHILLIHYNLFIACLQAVDVVLVTKHVPDAILEERGIGLGRVTKRRVGEWEELHQLSLETMGHFRVAVCLGFEVSLGAQLLKGKLV